MTAGYKSVNVEFDDLFDPDIVGDGPSATGYAVGGTAMRYAALTYGTKRADVGYARAGVDVSNLWAAKGTATYNPSHRSVDAISGGTLNPASIELRILTNGTMRLEGFEYNTEVFQDDWNYAPTAAGASSLYDFRISGTFDGIRDSNASGSASGKGGVAFVVAVTPGNTAPFNSGWITTADDAAFFLQIKTGASGTVGGYSGLNAELTIEVRRKSDLAVVRTFTMSLTSNSDGTA